MANKRLEWISVSSLIAVITFGIVMGTISLGSKGSKPTGSDNKTKQTDVKEKKADKSKKENLDNDSDLADGVYEGTARGYSSDVTVKVTIKDGKIDDIEVVSQGETPEYFNEAVKVLDDIIDANSTDVDSISGATISSEALKEAVQNALQKAQKKGGAKKSKSSKDKNKKKSSKRSKSSRRSGGAIGSGGGHAPKALASSSVNIPAGGRLKDGTYQGQGQGFRGNISVSVRVVDGKIAGVDILSYNDDDAYFNSALAVIDRMIGGTSGNVDSVSGATYSSVGIMNAVNDALNKAVENPSNAKAGEKSNAKRKPNQANNKQGGHKIPSPPANPSQPPAPTLPKSGKLKDGSYQGSATGYRGPISVSVTISNGKISRVDVLSHGEDAAFFSQALGVIDKMIGGTSGNVDSVSGATYSSVGIMNAVNDAINKAIASTENKLPEIKPQPSPGSEEKPGEKPQPSPGGEEKPGEKPQPNPGSEEKPGEKPQSKEEKALEEKMRKGDLAEGSFTGEGFGYNTGRGKVKTTVKIKDGKILDITRDEQNYPDDGDTFRTTSAKIINFLKDPVNGKRNIAIMKMHMDMVEQIANATDPVAKARELIGDAGANYIKNNKHKTFYPLRGYASMAVRDYLAAKYKVRPMFDAVSGATLSAGGTALSVDAALAKAENDKKTNSNIDSIKVVENKDALISNNFYTHKAELLSNKADPLDLSDLKVKLIYKDKKEEIVSYKDFAKYGLEIKGEDGKEISDKMTFPEEVKAKRVFNATITHKASHRSVDLAIKFGLYSKDYIKKMEYSLDEGQSWTEIENPNPSDENKNNIADKQNIKLNKDKLGKKIQVRTTSVRGNTYTYKSDDKGVQFDRIKLSCVDNSYNANNNASFAVFLVISEDKSSPSKPDHEVDPQKPETEASDGDINLSFAPKNLNHRKIDELTIKAGEGVEIKSAEGLPNGLRLEGNKIVGTIEIADDKFTDVYRQIDVTIHATKDGNNIKKTFKMDLYQDKDRDGVDDNEEGEKGANRFDPTTPDGRTPTIEKVRGDDEPTIDEYKALFNNIPNDGSVKVEITQHPDMKTKKPQAIARLKFTSSYVSGTSSKPVAVKLIDAPKGEEVEAEDGDIEVNFTNKLINHHKIDDVTINTGAGVKVKSVDGLPKGLSLVDGKITGSLDIDDKDFAEDYKEIEITIHGSKSAKNIKKTVKMPIYQDKDRDGVDDSGDANPNAFNPEFKGKEFKDKCVHGFIGDAEPSIDDYKKLFKNIPDDGSVTIEITQKPNMSKKVSMAKLKFISKYVSETSTVTVGVILESKPDPKVQLEKTIENLTLRSELLDGEFIGYGVGFDESRGKLKTIVKIENGDIKQVTFVEGKGYSGMDYMTKSLNAIPYLAGADGKRNVAILRAHESYVNQIVAFDKDEERKKKAYELIGKEYADRITDLRRPEMISPLVREFIANNGGGDSKKMLDAVTGATLTSGGLGQSVDNALRMSENDRKTGNTIKEIKVVEPSEINGLTGQNILKQDRSKALDLSRLKVELVDKDGTKKTIAYEDFSKNGIEIRDRETGKLLTNNMNLTEEEMNQAIIADITHKDSMRSTDFAIQFETYSDDYIVAMEYSSDGGNSWQSLANPVQSEENSKNISYRQKVKIKDSELNKVFKFRITTQAGKVYEYNNASPITEYGFKYSFGKDEDVAKDNPNAHFALYITFEKEGATESKPDVEKPDDGSGEGSDNINPEDAKEVGAEEINASLENYYINHKKINPISITKADGVTIEDVEGLPEGLDLVDGSITGEVDTYDEFSSMKEYEFTIYGRKNGKAIKRTLKLTVYQDKDRDGTSAMDEGEDGDMMFNPNWSARKIDKKVGDSAPTVDEYMNLITNLPDDGSVSITLLKYPDMSKPGNNMIRIEIKSSNVPKTTTQTINVSVS